MRYFLGSFFGAEFKKSVIIINFAIVPLQILKFIKILPTKNFEIWDKKINKQKKIIMNIAFESPSKTLSIMT